MKTLHQTDEIIRDRYRIVAPIGKGSMGTTYEAEDLTDYKRVAMKVVSLRQAQDWKTIELFDREGRVLANLQHPGIPKYLDRFQEDTPSDRRFYLVQALAPGESLAALVEKGWRPDERRVRDMALQLLDILDYLHGLTPPVIHRDIKPHNIIRDGDGKLYLVDFGAVQDVYRNTLTRGGTFVGTLGYMPHEQFRGQVGAASDLYALGATLLFLLAGKSPAELPQKRMKIDFRRHVKISPEFARWLGKMLEPAVEDRFASAIEAASEMPGELKSPPPRQWKAAQMTKTSPSSPHSNPHRSRFSLEKTSNTLICEVPQNWGIFCGLLVTSVVLGFIFVPFGLMLAFVLFQFSQQQSLRIDRQMFTIESRFLGCLVHRVRGETADIQLVDVEVQVSSKGGQTFSLIIWEGVRKHYFGQFLNRFEKKWLATEISDFLKLRQLKATQS